MTHQQKKCAENAAKNPEKIYDTPEQVLMEPRLGREEKLRILESWRSDQNALLRADNENMPNQNEPRTQPDPAAMLARIEKACRSLQREG